MPGPGARFKNAPYLVNATGHWLPMVNGYSGLHAPGFMADIYRGMRRFPRRTWSIAWLRSNRVNRIVVHAAEFEQLKGTPQLQKVETWPDLELLATAGRHPRPTACGRAVATEDSPRRRGEQNF